jgi:hypothetical protein
VSVAEGSPRGVDTQGGAVNVDSILLADYATVTSDNKLTVVGAFNQIHVPKFPTVHPQVYISLVIHAHPREAGDHNLCIRLLDKTRAELARLEAEFKLLRRKGPEGMPLRMLIAPGILGLTIPAEGPYAFEVLIDDTYAATASFYARLR